MDRHRRLSMELLIILIIAVVILAVLVIIALSRMCCSLLSVYSEYKKAKHPRDAASTESTRSVFSSTVKTEKLALIDNCSRLERETGIRISDYPFAVDYSRPLPLVIATRMAAVTEMRRSQRRGENDATMSNEEEEDSQQLGSDSPRSEPFAGSQSSTLSEGNH